MKNYLLSFLLVSGAMLAMDRPTPMAGPVAESKKTVHDEIEERVQAKKARFLKAIRESDFETVKALHKEGVGDFDIVQQALKIATDEKIIQYLTKYYQRMLKMRQEGRPFRPYNQLPGPATTSTTTFTTYTFDDEPQDPSEQ